MLSTTEITSRSFQLYKENWKPMLLLGLFVVGVQALVELLTASLGETGGDLLSSLIILILSPVIVLGWFHYLVQLWSEKQPAISEIWRFCSSSKVYGKALWFELCYLIFEVLIALVILILPLFVFTLPLGLLNSNISILILLVILMVPVFWLLLRIYIAEFLFLFRTEEASLDIILNGFKMTKGYIGKLILLHLVIFMMELIYAVPQYLVTEQILFTEFHSFVSVFVFICQVIIQPLTVLMLTGFACEVLREHGVIADEHAELVEDGSESFASADSDVQDAVIADKNDDIYYDEI